MELTGKTPTNAELIAVGMADYSLRGVEVEPTPGVRGYQKGMKAKAWSCTITGFDAVRPLVRAIRDNPDEADRDARLRFIAIFSKGHKIDAVSDIPKNDVQKKIKPQTKVDLDDEAASLI
jgi:hypothetical protein